ncbi:hypothetical protein ABZ760_24200 [Streptomyces sp. NPDC006658]|uniref:hypothetical protein n=1 Tax=Streptomyces sp. NPDC006658 TaxID=3156900 RepID=UPI0033E4B501
MTGPAWSRPAAGREPAAAALLAWLSDAGAPRLCVVTGSAGCGKSSLLAWLIGHGTRDGERPERRVHGFVPLAGQTALTAAWTLARQLSVAARTPGELLTALSADDRRTVLVLPELHAAEDPAALAELAARLAESPHVRVLVEVRSGSAEAGTLTRPPSAVMDLDETRWTDPERYAAWTAGRPATGPVPPPEPETVGTVDLDDPAAVCAADPWQVSVRYERSGDGHGGLRAAWLRAGASLTHEPNPADRAMVLLAALGDEADPRLPDRLAGLADGAAWRVVWRRVRGDVRPPWPGPARALSSGHGRLAGTAVVADHQGTVRLVGEADGAPVGRLPEPVGRVAALTVTAGGDVLVLDTLGGLHLRPAPAAPRATGLAALLEDGPTPLERLVETVRARLRNRPRTLAACGDVLTVADDTGHLHAFVCRDGETVPSTVRLHEGAVTALAALDLAAPGEDGPGIPLVYSGGADGKVRAWGPGAEPLAVPVRSRTCPVTALAAAATGTGPVLAVGWADGLVEHHRLDDGTVRAYRPGLAVHALALTDSGDLLVGTDETLVCLRPVTVAP